MHQPGERPQREQQHRDHTATAPVALAFAEKLTNPNMAREILEAYPQVDVFSWVGIELAPDTFVAIAGAIEVLFGLLVLSGAMPQVATLVAAVPFNLSLLLFGQTELIGHLPVYGVFLALLVYGSDARTAHLVRWLPTTRRLGSSRTEHLPAPAAPSEQLADH